MFETVYYMVRNKVMWYFLDVLKYTIPIFIVILLLRYFLQKEKKMNIKKLLYGFIFVAYIITVCLLTDILNIRISDFTSMHMSPNIIPLLDTINGLKDSPMKILPQILSNIIFFIPLGVLLFLYYPKMSIKKVFVISGGFSLLVEILEYFRGRYCDIDDLLCNVLGAIIGAIGYKGFCFVRGAIIRKKENNVS